MARKVLQQSPGYRVHKDQWLMITEEIFLMEKLTQILSLQEAALEE